MCVCVCVCVCVCMYMCAHVCVWILAKHLSLKGVTAHKYIYGLIAKYKNDVYMDFGTVVCDSESLQFPVAVFARHMISHHTS